MDERLKESLDRIFHPSSTAIVGVSERMDNPGTLFLRAYGDMGFQGGLYPVNPRHGEILGRRCYPDLTSLPEVPDLVILAVPPAAVPPLVQECAALSRRREGRKARPWKRRYAAPSREARFAWWDPTAWAFIPPGAG